MRVWWSSLGGDEIMLAVGWDQLKIGRLGFIHILP